MSLFSIFLKLNLSIYLYGMSQDQKFSEEARRIIDIVENSTENLFVTGKAGTGKSTLLEHLRSLPEQKMVVWLPQELLRSMCTGRPYTLFLS